MINIKCCIECVAPKRHYACHDTCPDYKEEKAEELRKANMKYKEDDIDRYVHNSVKRMKDRSRRGRGINHHAK